MAVARAVEGEVAVAEATADVPVGIIEVAVLVACVTDVLVRVAVEVAPPGVNVGVGEEQVPLTAENAILELVGGVVLHRYCTNPPNPSCTPIVEVAVVFSAPRIISKLDVASYNRISK